MIGLFGGTFAPIHNGHLRLAIEAREQLGLDAVHLVVAARPPLKDAPAIAAERRLRWVRLAVAGEPGLVADDRELARTGPSYTIDTIEAVRRERPDEPLCLLLGQDAARQLPQWQRWRELIGYAHLVFFNRPGEKPAMAAPVARLLRGRKAASAAALRRRRAGLWWRGAVTPLAMSASGIRACLRAGRSVRGLVSDRVIDDFTSEDLAAFRRDRTAP